jgi:hypothetical protein
VPPDSTTELASDESSGFLRCESHRPTGTALVVVRLYMNAIALGNPDPPGSLSPGTADYLRFSRMLLFSAGQLDGSRVLLRTSLR